MNNRCNRCDDSYRKKKLEDFKSEAAIWRKKVKLDSKLEKDYITWLEQKKIEFKISNKKFID